MYSVDGESFVTESEYKLALRDKEVINQIKKSFDIRTVEGVKGAFLELKNVQFSTSVGDKFDDFIFEQYEKVKAGTFEEVTTEVSNKKALKEKSKKTALNKTANSNKKNIAPRLSDIKDPELKKQVAKELKRQSLIRNMIIALLVLIALGSIGYYVKYYYDAKEVEDTANEWSELKDSKFAEILHVEPVLKKEYEEEVVIPEILDEYVAIYNKNKSLIGWIKIADTIIDYPVMQTTDNDYYLKYNFNQKKDANGAIFMDCKCDAILGNTNWILYGHHMNNGKMFSSLIKYANQDYYEKHKIIEFDTIYEKGQYEVIYAFRSRVYSSDQITFKYYQFIDANSQEEFDSAMEEMEKDSLIKADTTASYGDKLLTLSTCDYQEENGRFVVVAKRIN